jgi:hypothetical protein
MPSLLLSDEKTNKKKMFEFFQCRLSNYLLTPLVSQLIEILFQF